jgi:hypothetical protein
MIVREMRPRFRLEVPEPPDAVVGRIDERLKLPDSSCSGMVAENHHVVELRVHERDRHFWSPALSVTVTDDADSGSVIHGLIGPDPNVWTLFAMLYMGILTFLAGVGIFGLIQWWLDLTPWGLYLVPVLLVALVAMYGISRIGQKLATPQTIVLRAFLEEALDLPERQRAIVTRDPYHE